MTRKKLTNKQYFFAFMKGWDKLRRVKAFELDLLS